MVYRREEFRIQEQWDWEAFIRNKGRDKAGGIYWGQGGSTLKSQKHQEYSTRL